MKIKRIHVNVFGNIKNKQIELNDHINIIKGNNESGKSTLLKFIVDMFYGISKNKKGKEFSDYDRYLPWNGEEFSGKLSYELDNGEKYEIFRDFNKKNPKIYNENLEDISKEFTIDKTNGNQFFVEQTNIDEDTFLSTYVSMQKEVILQNNEQNILVQKIANLAGTGEDNISYKKAIEKINKRQVEEIGTTRSQGRPINIIKQEQYELQDEIGELEEYKNKKNEIEEKKNELEQIIEEKEIELKKLKELKIVEDNKKLKQQKIQFYEGMIESNEQEINRLNELKNDLNEKIKNCNKEKNIKEKSKDKKTVVLSTIIILCIALLIIFIKNKIVTIISSIIAVLYLIVLTYIIINNKRNKLKKEASEKNNYLENELIKINDQLELLERHNSKQQNELQKMLNSIENENNINEDVDKKIESLQEEINKNKLNLHSLELDKENIIPKLEKLANMEEKLEELNEKEEELIKKNNAMELAKQILEKSYTEMKKNITPKFTENLSYTIEKISNGKYKNVRIHDEQGIIIEKENGEYEPVQKLSVGTIDQLYLSLRIGAIKEISKENMPIVLDEAFAYYDEDRLENILKFLNENFKENQIIIFTCTNREQNVLEKLNIGYNIVCM